MHATNSTDEVNTLLGLATILTKPAVEASKMDGKAIMLPHVKNQVTMIELAWLNDGFIKLIVFQLSDGRWWNL